MAEPLCEYFAVYTPSSDRLSRSIVVPSLHPPAGRDASSGTSFPRGTKD
jgi:hypothetical protein